MMEPYWEGHGLTLYCGDAFEIMPTLKADVCFADEPNPNEFWSPGAKDMSWGRWADGLRFRNTETDGWRAQVPTTGIRSLHVLTPPHAVVPWLSSVHEFTLAGFTVWERPDLAWDALLHFGADAGIPRIVDHGARETDLSFERGYTSLMAVLEAVTRPGDVLLNPFSGSGATLAAATRLGIEAIGIERDERFCEIIAKRLA